MAKANTGRGTVQSDRTLFSIIETLHQKKTAGVTELANELDITKGAVHKHLKTLEEAGYLNSSNGRYQLGFKFLTLGGKVRGTNPLCVAARSAVDKVSDTTGELGSFGVYENGECVYTYLRNDNYGITNRTLIGEALKLNQCAEGKAILAALPDEEIKKLEFGPATDETGDPMDNIYENIRNIRDQGYALSTGNLIKGLNAIATPVSYEDTLGAIAISGPANRFTPARMKNEYRDILLSVVNEMELRIRHGEYEQFSKKGL